MRTILAIVLLLAASLAAGSRVMYITEHKRAFLCSILKSSRRTILFYMHSEPPSTLKHLLVAKAKQGVLVIVLMSSRYVKLHRFKDSDFRHLVKISSGRGELLNDNSAVECDKHICWVGPKSLSYSSLAEHPTFVVDGDSLRAYAAALR